MTNTINNYKIISINVNSLISYNKKLSLMHFLETNRPDIICMSETKLKSTDHMVVDSYNLIRRDRKIDIDGGGVAIGIKKQFHFNIVNNDIFNNFQCIEPVII